MPSYFVSSVVRAAFRANGSHVHLQICLVTGALLCAVSGKFYSGGSCELCHPSCRACTGPMSVECTRCQPGTVLHNVSNLHRPHVRGVFPLSAGHRPA